MNTTIPVNKNIMTPAEEQAFKIKSQYKMKPPKPEATEVGKLPSFREKILALSLFPNLYNKNFILKNG